MLKLNFQNSFIVFCLQALKSFCYNRKSDGLKPMQKPQLERCNGVKKWFSRGVCESVPLSCHRIIYKNQYIVGLLQLQSPKPVSVMIFHQ